MRNAVYIYGIKVKNLKNNVRLYKIKMSFILNIPHYTQITYSGNIVFINLGIEYKNISYKNNDYKIKLIFQNIFKDIRQVFAFNLHNLLRLLFKS